MKEKTTYPHYGAFFCFSFKTSPFCITFSQNSQTEYNGPISIIISLLYMLLLCFLFIRLSPLFTSSVLFSSHHLFFFLSSFPHSSTPWFQVAMVTQLFPGQRPESQSDSMPSHTHTHARTEPVWRCQRPDESNDRLTSVYRPQLTSPLAAHKQLISLLTLPSFVFLVLFFCLVLRLFHLSFPSHVFVSFLSSGQK